MSNPLPSLPRPFIAGEGRPTVLVPFLIVLAAVVQVIWQYPDHFFPRYWDEAVYAWDAIKPGAMLGEQSDAIMRYAPSKIGYGLPLAGSVAVFGIEGGMYLSTLFWLLTIATVGWTTLRLWGTTAGSFAAAFLSYSPLFGKYATEIGPTTLAAFCFAALWAVNQRRKFLMTGLIAGILALVDFKWAVPVALAMLANEFIVERERSLRAKAAYIAGTGLTAVVLLGLVLAVHAPFRDYLYNYIFGHAENLGFTASGIVLYYLFLFGAAPALALATVTLLTPAIRHLAPMSSDAKTALASAVIFFAIPTLFYSLIGSLKALRFFAVPFPLLAMVIGAGLGMLAKRLIDKLTSMSIPSWVSQRGVALIVGGTIVLAALGPADHLRLETGYEMALRKLDATTTRDGNVTSYIWPVVKYGWRFPTTHTPFIMWGLNPDDKWIILNSALDRVTIENRIVLSGTKGVLADTVWQGHRNSLRLVSDSLFSVPADFYASDYYLCENVVGGIDVLRKWRRWQDEAENHLEVLAIVDEKKGLLEKRE